MDESLTTCLLSGTDRQTYIERQTGSTTGWMNESQYFQGCAGVMATTLARTARPSGPTSGRRPSPAWRTAASASSPTPSTAPTSSWTARTSSSPSCSCVTHRLSRWDGVRSGQVRSGQFVWHIQSKLLEHKSVIVAGSDKNLIFVLVGCQ